MVALADIENRQAVAEIKSNKFLQLFMLILCFRDPVNSVTKGKN